MATVNQIYTMVNDAADESLGVKAITVKDTATLVSLGEVVLSTKDNKDLFYHALCDRIGRTVFAIREIPRKTRSVKRDELEWGVALQKISYSIHKAVDNPSWESSTQADPFDVEIQTEAVQKIFSVVSTWSHEDSIPDYQLYTAFTNAAAMAGFIAGIYTNMTNKLHIDEDNLANLAIATNIAGVLIQGTKAQKRNVLTEYNTLTGQTLTPEAALRDMGFLKYVSREMYTVTGNFKEPTTVYNADRTLRYTPEEKMVVEVLGQFASAASFYLQADTYHDSLVALPRYEEVAFWQGSGETTESADNAFKFDEVSKIAVKNSKLATTSNATGEITQGGVIAFIHDYDSAMSIIHRRRDNSIYNPRAERYNVFMKADQGYAVDLSENAVVFILA